MGASEDIFWQRLRNRMIGFKFRRQVPLGPYTIDFFCREVSLAVELDGEVHRYHRDRDAVRDEWLRSRGVEVVRIPTLDLFEESGLELGRWLDRIELLCEQRRRPSPPTPSPATNHAGEGAFGDIDPSEGIVSDQRPTNRGRGGFRRCCPFRDNRKRPTTDEPRWRGGFRRCRPFGGHRKRPRTDEPRGRGGFRALVPSEAQEIE
jgi:very-short-patch-repair endonuclease